jgi:hypothetical protein
MILHFMKRDFLSSRFEWSLVAIISAVLFAVLFFNQGALIFLGYLYFFFPLAASSKISTSRWRSQHSMSRNYLLALPVPRNRIFNAILLRQMIYWIPMFIFLTIVPIFCWPKNIPYSAASYIVFEIASITIASWFSVSLVGSQLMFERITSHSSRQRRFWIYFLSTTSFFAEVIIIICPLLFALEKKVPLIIPLLIAASILWFRFNRTRRSWVGV